MDTASEDRQSLLLPSASLDQQNFKLPKVALIEESSDKTANHHSFDSTNDHLFEKINIEPVATVVELESNTESRRPSTASTIGLQYGTYRRMPMVMVGGLIIGISCSVALHFYYFSFNGTLVGTGYDQQRALRIGTTLAFCAQVCLIYSIQKAFEQWLWRELKSHVVSFKGIDAAFAAPNDPWSFVNFEMWSVAKRASVLALVLWLIPISTLIAPATLNVHTVMVKTISRMNVPTLDISQAGPYASYSYAVTGTPPSLQKYEGPRTIITRLAVAAAATGDILTLQQPATNATYQQTFFGPYVHCDGSTAEVRQQVNGMIDRAQQALDLSVELISLDYFAAIPVLSDLSNTSGEPVQVANLTDIDDAEEASNQLWVYFRRYNASLDFTEPVEQNYLTCQLYNASCTTRFMWENGRQDLQVMNRSLINPVPYPINASTSAESEVAMSYSAVMWAVSNQLTGSIGFYKDLNSTDNGVTQEVYASHVYSQIATNMAQTVLLGTSDLDSHFLENHLLGNSSSSNIGSSSFSSQRLQDMGYARNQPLEILIPQLSSNITLSFLNDPLLATPTNVTLTYPANTYVYHERSLLLAYAVAGTVALLADAVGLYAIYNSGVSHDLLFSSIACSSHGIHFSKNLRAHERLGALPLESRIAKTLLQFFQGENGRWGWGEAERQSKARRE